MTTRYEASSILAATALAALLTPGLAAPLAAWILKGPAPAINGQPEITDSPISGAVETVVAHPTDPNIIWIGSVNGGIFRTNNGASSSPTWTQQTDNQTSLSIGALELDPTDATHSTLVAGIGRTSSFGNRGGATAGILRTTNGGSTWANPGSSNISNLHISGVAARGASITVSVAQGSISTAGIYRSVDFGASFVRISELPGFGLPEGLAWDLVGDPTSSTRLFTAITDPGDVINSGIYRSEDSGFTWTKVSDVFLDLALINADNVHLAVGKGGPVLTNVFTAVCTSGRLSNLFRSGLGSLPPGSLGWTALDIPQTTEQGTAYGIHPGGQCGTHLSLVADSGDVNVVFIGGDRQPANNENGTPIVPQFPNSIGANNYSGRLFRVDADQTAGSQATPITNCASATTACGGSARTANDTSPHADSREMVFDANGDILQTDDGGIYKHTNPNGTTGDWQSIIGDLAATEQHSMALDGVSNILLSGNQDNGSTAQQTSTNTIWSAFDDGDGGDVVVAMNDPVAGQSTRYHSSQRFGGRSRRVYDANNVLQGASSLSLTPLAGSPAPTFPFTTPIEVNKATPTRLILGAANGTYESTDRLGSVTRISTATVNANGRGPIAYGVASNPNALYFGSGDDLYVRTAAPPAAPVQRDPGGGTDDIAGVVMDPANANTAYAVDTDQVFRTTNGGTSWSEITGDLQTTWSPGTFRSIEYIDFTSGTDSVAIGADRGVYISSVADFSIWTLQGGLPNAPVFDLDYDQATDTLAAGTLGRGTWTLSFSCPGDAFEPDNSSGQAMTLAEGPAQNRGICPSSDQDWVTFNAFDGASVRLETSSGFGGDTRMWLYDDQLNEVEFDDDDGDGLFSQILRTCNDDPLPAGNYFVKIDEFGNNNEIPIYALELETFECDCPTSITLDGSTFTGTFAYFASTSATLGTNATFDGTNIVIKSPTVEVRNGTELRGRVALGNDPTCP